jgi:hypothetical protein
MRSQAFEAGEETEMIITNITGGNHGLRFTV